MATIPKAKGIKGFLVRTISGDYVIRVYDTNHDFIDYKIYHDDLEIEITDDDACCYEIDSKNIIDYSPKTLGRDYDL